MKKLRQSIAEDRLKFFSIAFCVFVWALWKLNFPTRFPAFVHDFFLKLFPNLDFPAWASEALASVGVVLPSWLVRFTRTFVGVFCVVTRLESGYVCLLYAFLMLLGWSFEERTCVNKLFCFSIDNREDIWTFIDVMEMLRGRWARPAPQADVFDMAKDHWTF